MPNQFATHMSRQDAHDIVAWKNESKEIIPPFACVQMDGYDPENNRFSAVKPDDYGSLFYVNGPSPVPVKGLGTSLFWTRPQACLAVIIANSAKAGRIISTKKTEVSGREVGPVPGQWSMSSAGAGFRVLTDVDDSPDLLIISPLSVRELVVVLDEDIDAANSGQAGRSGLATVNRWNEDNEQYEDLVPKLRAGKTEKAKVQVKVWNHSESTDHEKDTLGIARWIENHLWFFGDCAPLAERS